MFKGETGVLTATVKPVGLPVVWTSSNETRATVNNGMVSAIDAGTAVVTAEVTNGDVTASDTCTVQVSEYELVRDMTKAEVWNNPAMWVQREYTETTRSTYVEFEEQFALVHNSDGTSTTLYADLRPEVANFEHEDGYTYEVQFEWNNAQTPNNTFEITVQRNSSSNTLNAVGEIAAVFTAAGANGNYSVPVEFTGNKARLLTIQIRKGDAPENGKCFMNIRVVRKLA